MSKTNRTLSPSSAAFEIEVAARAVNAVAVVARHWMDWGEVRIYHHAAQTDVGAAHKAAKGLPHFAIVQTVKDHLPWSSLLALRSVASLLVGDCGAFTYWQRTLKAKARGEVDRRGDPGARLVGLGRTKGRQPNAEGWPWDAVPKDTRMRAYIEAFESIRHVPRVKEAQTTIFDLPGITEPG